MQAPPFDPYQTQIAVGVVDRDQAFVPNPLYDQQRLAQLRAHHAHVSAQIRWLQEDLERTEHQLRALAARHDAMDP